MHNKLIVCCTVLSLLVGAACSGGSSQRSREAQVDALFEEYDNPNSPGCALGVIQDGKFLYRRGYGSANLDYDIPIDSKSVFYIASTSKQFAAACVAMLSLRGELALDDDIREYFPELPDYGLKIRVRNLLHHTSGLRDYLTLTSIAGRSFEDYFDNNYAIELLSRQKSLNFTPGDEYLYSNSGYVTIAELIKRVSGKSLREFSEENIFRPLGMVDTHWNDDRKMIVRNRVVSYQTHDDGTYRRFLKNFDAVGDGALLTTVDDLYRWDQNFYDNKLDEGLGELILTRGRLNDGEELDYAFGLMHGEYRGLKTVSHGGGMLGFRTQMIRFPEERFTVICLSNLGGFNPTRYCRKVADIYLFDGEAPPEEAEDTPAESEQPITLSDEERARLAGRYVNSEAPYGAVRIVNSADGLKIVVAGIEGGLRALTSSEFETEGLPVAVRLTFESRGEEQLVHTKGEGSGENTYRKVSVEPLSSVQLAQYEGTFYSAELDATHIIEIANDELRFTHRNAPEEPLAAIENDEFRAGSFRVSFLRTPNGQVMGYVLDAGRVRNLQFLRNE